MSGFKVTRKGQESCHVPSHSLVRSQETEENDKPMVIRGRSSLHPSLSPFISLSLSLSVSPSV